MTWPVSNDTLAYYEYRTATGEITQFGETNEQSFEVHKARAAATVTVSEGVADGATQYVADGTPIDRPVFRRFDKTTIAIGDEATIKGLPNPTTVTVNGTSHTVTDGEFVLTATATGKFTIVISAFPYLDCVETITCV
ncbi:hypothetical protein [Telmatospirillum sp.]|uniref:hypothetical protein n=1 Tax=Telmatospirillum sp. TaxID=2079197 RepID=UPI00284D6443|nr:hypothetical protein [Telmatospirillum sp.]MDR3436444.1 hypothetical protein [Telmatospirillum sp.]